MSLYDCDIDHHLHSDDPIVSLKHLTLEFCGDPIHSDIPEQNLNLSSSTQDDFPNYEKNWCADPSLLCPDRRCPSSKAPSQRRPPNPNLKCSVCGKMFGSKSSLNKHVVCHSQQRNHVCTICKKAFKRQDHLTGHTLTHRNSDPFMCTEIGCNKSYRDSRSLKKHLVFHHGHCALMNGSDTTSKKLQKKEQPKSFPVLPSSNQVEAFSSQPLFSIMDPIQYQLNKNSQEQVMSHGVFEDPRESLVPLTVALHKNTMVPKYTQRSFNSIPSNSYSLINTTNKMCEDPETILYPVEDFLGLWSDKSLKSISPKQSLFVYPEARSLLGLVHNSLKSPPVKLNSNKPVEMYVSSVSTSLVDPDLTTLDTISPNQQGSTKVTLPTYESFCSQLQNQQQFVPVMDFRPLSSKELSQNHLTLMTCSCLPEIITRPVTPQKDIQCTKGEQNDAFAKVDIPESCFQAGEQAILSETCCVKDCSPCSVPFTSIGKPKEQQLADGLLLNAFTCSSPLSSSKSETGQKLGSHHQNSSLSEELTWAVDNTVSLSQIAVEPVSFTPKLPNAETNSGVMVFKEFQEENIYQLPKEEKEGTAIVASRLSTSFNMMELADFGVSSPSGSVVEKIPSVCRGKKSLRRPLQGVRKEGREYCKRKLSPQAPEPSPGVLKNPEPFVMPVSVPVTMTDHHEDSKVKDAEGDSQNQNSKKRKRPFPKPLYIPHPLLEAKASPKGCFQSNLRSPNTYLHEHFQNGIFQYPAYTPPPMLSPIRPGSGLYFNAFCSPSTGAGPTVSFPENEISPCEILPVKDSMVFTVQPHINIGNRFQAEIPKIQDLLSLGGDKADLVWKPMKITKSVSNFLNLACSSAVPGGGHNLEFALHCLHLSKGKIMEALDKLLIQDPQKYLPQCLANYHYAGSDHWSAAEERQFKKAYRINRKNFSYIQAMVRLVTDGPVREKNLYQCVEYYYSWKKRIRLDKRGIGTAGKKSSFDERESKCNNNDAISGDKTAFRRSDVKEMPPCKIQEDTRPLSHFQCKECDRVFDKVKSRNAHMRKHRQEDGSSFTKNV